MPRHRLGIWSPHRDSHSVLALKAALSLRAERWQWCERPEEASFWIVDAQSPQFSELTAQLKHVQSQHAVFAAVLAAEWSVLRDPVWTFLKVPLQVKVVYQWIDTCLQKNPQTALTWTGQQLKLKRWPNVSKYTGTQAVTSVQITALCGRLLTDWVSYEDLCRDLAEVGVLDQLLADAQARGILEYATAHPTPPQPPSTHPMSASAAEAATAAPDGAWGLIKRLIRKLA